MAPSDSADPPGGSLSLPQTPNHTAGSAAASATEIASSHSSTTGHHEFNEQTNYVPKRTIITVSFT